MQSRKTVHSSTFDKKYKKTLLKRLFLVSLSLIIFFNGGITWAQAETVPMDFPRLAQVGPIHEDNGYPVWYEDSQGTRLQLCLDVNDPLCAMILDEIPDPSQPLSLKAGNFPGESFYQLAESAFTLPNGGSALGVFALEAAFANEDPKDGDQIVFGRVRLRIDGLSANQTYTITHPYGIDIIRTDGEGEINFTEDIGINTGFQGALTSRIGTFLQWDAGAPEGYLGDPNVGHKIIGGLNNQNYFQIQGPGIGIGSCGPDCAQTEIFSVMGKKATIAGVEISAPVVNEVTEQSTTVTGTAEAGTIVEVKSGTDLLGTATTTENGSFSVTIPVQSAGTILLVTATGSTGNVSRATKVTVKDNIAPAAPVVKAVTDQDTAVTGTAEAGSTVEVKSGNTDLGTATASQTGSFNVKIPVQSAGTILTVTAKDASGNVSNAAQVTVKDITPPAVPVVKEVTDKATAVTGTAEADSTVEVTSGDTILGSSTAAKNGSFSVAIPSQLVGTILTVTAKDTTGNVSVAVKVTVKDRTAPAVPEVNEVSDQATAVTGTAEASSTVEIKSRDTVLGTATAAENGSFSVTIPVQSAGTILSISAKDAAGNVSEAAQVTVIDKTAPAVPQVNEVGDQATDVTGTTEAGSAVEIKSGDTVLGTATAAENGSFSVTIPVQSAGTILSISAKDAAGNVSDAVKVTVQDKTAPAAPKVNKVTDQSTTIAGTAEANTDVVVKVGTTVITTGKTNSSGNFSFAIVKQKAGTKINVSVKDSAENTSPSTTVTVVDVTAPKAPVVNRVTDNDTFVKGKAEAGSTVIVKVGSTIIGTGKTNSLGNFSLAILKRKAGTKISVAVKDNAGNSSPSITVTVVDVTAPKVPVVNKVKEIDTFVKGKAEPGSTVFVKVGSSTIGTGKTNSLGNFSVTIKKRKAGTKISVVVKDNAGNSSKTTSLTVLDVIAPKTPKVNTIRSTHKVVKGTAEPGSTVYVKIGTKIIGKGKTNSSGNFTVKITKRKKGTKISVVVKDSAGHFSPTKKVTVVK
jgi:hypothetical protein